MIPKKAHFESYVKVLRSVADDWEAGKRLTKVQAVQLLLVAMEINITQALQSSGVVANHFHELQARIDYVVPIVKEIGEHYGEEGKRGVKLV
jgi:hypothetical protein